VNAASGRPKPAADAIQTHTETTTGGRTADAVALGAFVGACGPVSHGTDALGRWFLKHHRDSIAEALGALLVRVAQLERKAKER
jgi:hypothetical protein